MAQASHLQPWYAEQAYSMEDWVHDSPMVIMGPRSADSDGSTGGVEEGG